MTCLRKRRRKEHLFKRIDWLIHSCRLCLTAWLTLHVAIVQTEDVWLEQVTDPRVPVVQEHGITKAVKLIVGDIPGLCCEVIRRCGIYFSMVPHISSSCSNPCNIPIVVWISCGTCIAAGCGWCYSITTGTGVCQLSQCATCDQWVPSSGQW